MKSRDDTGMTTRKEGEGRMFLGNIRVIEEIARGGKDMIQTTIKSADDAARVAVDVTWWIA